MDLFSNLNDNQKEAVAHINGPLLVIAGAGAGKTKVITHRVAYLIQNGVKPEQILAVTFTNKAADEMKERIGKLLTLPTANYQTQNMPTIGTFHSISARTLRENSRHIGRTRNFTILDEEDALKVVKNCLKLLEINPKQFQPAKIRSIISKQKSNLVKPDELAIAGGDNFFPRVIAQIWTEYEKTLEKTNSLDFDDLISKTVYFFKEQPEILEKYQDKWPFILIDEYQDTNHSQYILAKLLSKKHKNICVVGDEDQSIYGFRGANFGNILNFEKDWPTAKTVILEENYRSVQTILKAANAIISRNRTRKPKNLFSQLGEGQKIYLFEAFNEAEEAEFIASKSLELLKNGAKSGEIAVLYRANFQSRVLEELFLMNSLPYQVVGTKFFDRKEIKDTIAYLKAALNPKDILSVERIINEPPRGIGRASLLNFFSGKKLPADKDAKIKSFFKMLEEINDLTNKETASKVIFSIIKKTGYEDYLNNGTEEGAMRLGNLRELISLSAKYNHLAPPESVFKLVEETSLLANQDALDNKKEAIRLMTVHAAKGLEFKNVFICGLEEGLFPYSNFGNTSNKEEERRLFYVAITRAKEKIFLSYAQNRNTFGGRQANRPSTFLQDIPRELLEEANQIELPTIQL